MAKHGPKRDGSRTGKRGDMGKFDDDIDSLFRLPLGEFTAARNALAIRLKQSGHDAEAGQVKALVKPPVSAWTVNQLYWEHREEFEQLLETGQRFRKAQSLRGAGKIEGMREALDERREALAHLSRLATELLREAGHNPTLDMERRIATTLEALSAYTSPDDSPRPGRLTHDVDPPGFESLTSMMARGGIPERTKEQARVTPSQRPKTNATNIALKATASDKALQIDQTRQVKIAAAKVSLKEAKLALSEARATAKNAETAQKKADTNAKEAEKRKLEAEQNLEKARTALLQATLRARTLRAETEAAVKALEYAARDVEKASKELELLFGEP